MNLFFHGCKNNSNTFEPNYTSGSSEFNNRIAQLSDADLFMPDSIPDVVNQKAVEIAIKNNYSNIRLLQVKDREAETYHVYYFEDDLKGIAAYIAEVDVEKSKINLFEEVALPSSDESLGKIMTDTKCWELATFYTGAYQSGTSFTFSQSTDTHGWYHKISMDLSVSLGCCDDNYTGNLDNAITSHYWEDDCCSPAGRIARPIAVHVYDWENLNNWGDDKKFSTYSGDHDDHVDYPPTYSNQCGDYDTYGLDDEVSSIDMFYRVFTPS